MWYATIYVSMYRNIVLIVKDPIVTSKLFTNAFGLSIKQETEHMVEIDTNSFQHLPNDHSSLITNNMSPPIILKVH